MHFHCCSLHAQGLFLCQSSQQCSTVALAAVATISTTLSRVGCEVTSRWRVDIRSAKTRALELLAERENRSCPTRTMNIFLTPHVLRC